MLSIASSPAISWPSPTQASPVAVAPVAGVQPVRPVQGGQGSSREAQAETGPARDRPATAAGTELPRLMGQNPARESDLPEAAPLLPRERARQGQEPADAEAAESEAAQAEAEKAQQAERRKLPLQEVLTTVWRASAAVVDNALDGTAGTREAANDVSAAESVSPAGAPAAVSAGAQLPLPFPEALADRPVRAVAATEAPVAYDERGNAAVPPVEAGSLISERV